MSTPKRSNSVSSPTDEERSPKRQRRSYSPASPAAEIKQSPVLQPPQTPPPSVHMSPEWQAQPLPAVGNSGTGSVTFPTPPSTAGLQSQSMARGLSSEGDIQTPSYESETQVGSTMEPDGAPVEAKSNVLEVSGDHPIDEGSDADNRRSDHERHNQIVPNPEAAAVSTSSGACVLYKLQTEPIVPSAPHPSQDLIQLYALERLQSSVARRDPITGAKINKLRKSYEGKVKELGLDGRNKATKSEAILEGLADPGWDMKGADGTTLWETSDLCDPPLLVGDGGAEALSRIEGMLERALDLCPGHLPASEHNSWRNLLGLEDTVPNVATSAKSAPGTAIASSNALRSVTSNDVSKTGPATVVRNSVPTSPSTTSGLRPERVGKKRRYDESSYAGYQEGYEDDGYSTGGGGVDDMGRRGSSGAKRQKRKDFSAGSSGPALAGAVNGIVGVRTS